MWDGVGSDNEEYKGEMKMKTMRQKIIRFIIGLLTLLFQQCTSLEFHNLQKGLELNFATKEAECKEPMEFRHWTILYGTIPIRFLNTNPDELITGKNIRIKEKANWLDFVISILAGFSTSITIRTIVIENCDVVNVEKPREEIKIEETPQADTTPNTIPQVEGKSDKLQLIESKISEEKASEIIIDENSLIDEEPRPETKLAKTKTTKTNQKKK